MPSLDIFKDDAFSMTSLTDAINKRPYMPGRIGQLGVFQAKGITTTDLWVEEKSGALSLVQTTARGAAGGSVARATRIGRSFRAPHLQQNATVMADEVQNVRAFGSESVVETIQDLVNERNGEMQDNIAVTQEYHRMGAIQGLVLDADGSTLFNLFTEFSVAQQTQDFAFTTATTKVRSVIVAAKRLAENELGGVMVTGWRAFCGKNWFDALVDHATVIEAYKYQQGQQLQSDLRETGFGYGGVAFEEYRGSVAPQAGGAAVNFVHDDQAWLVPIVPGMYVTRFAPADYEETVNTIGLPFYAKQAPDPSGMNKYRALEVQSNPISLCLRPRAVIKLTRS
jgi:Phage major capsid protein E